MPARLVPRPRIALAAIAASVLVVGVLALLVHDDTHGNWFDNAVLRVVRDVVPDRVQGWGLDLTDPQLVIGLLVCLALVGAALLRWDVVGLVVAAPIVSVLLSEDVLKPLVRRSNDIVTARGLSATFAYPSGHETALASLVCVAGVVLLASGVRTSRTVLWSAVLGIVLVAGAVGLVGHFFHYATDTIGASGVALAVTLGVAMAIDAVKAWLTTRLREPARAPH
jgi:undecaprenyl-diphosphatase